MIRTKKKCSDGSFSCRASENGNECKNLGHRGDMEVKISPVAQITENSITFRRFLGCSHKIHHTVLLEKSVSEINQFLQIEPGNEEVKIYHWKFTCTISQSYSLADLVFLKRGRITSEGGEAKNNLVILFP